MKKATLLSGIGALGLVLLPVTALFLGGFLGSSAARIQRDHSLRLPSAASDIHCVRFISLSTFMDSGEQATFVIPKASLETFISQIEPRPEWIKFDQAKVSLAIPPSWTTRPVVARYCRRSTEDNMLTVEIFDLGNSKLGVAVATIWN